eukprot:scaffold54883_cov31-Tisochrysis_lutea.AAC.4
MSASCTSRAVERTSVPWLAELDEEVVGEMTGVDQCLHVIRHRGGCATWPGKPPAVERSV